MTALLEGPAVAPPAGTAEVQATPRRFRPDVEGLRAVAVGLVVLFHAGITWLPGGYVGVDVFFVISGFLITGLLLREFETEGRIGLTNFYARRARRILPLASVVLIVTVGASSILLTTIRMASIPIDGVWSSLFAANFRFANSGANYLNATAPPSPLQHFWSLAVEEQFYVVWPALLWLALHFSRRSGGRARVAVISTLAVGASLFWCIHQTAYDANTAYFSPFTRGWELGIGALVAVCAPWLVRAPRVAAAALGWVGLAMIGYAAVRFDAHTAFPGSAALVPVLGAAFVIAGGLLLTRGGPEYVLGRKPMQLVGKYSFGLYLWHWPILIIAEGHFQHLNVLEKLGLVVLAGLLSAVTFYRLENVVRRAPRLVKSPAASLAVGAAVIGASLIYSGFYVTGNRYVDERTQAQFVAAKQVSSGSSAPVVTPAEVLAAVQTATLPEVVPATLNPPLAIAARDRSAAYSDGCLVNPVTVTSPTCTFGSTSPSAPLVVLFGDANAVQWSPALATLAARKNFRYRMFTKDACPASTVSTYDSVLSRNYPECATWRTWALAQIKQLQPDAVIVSEHIQALAHATGRTGSVEGAWQPGLRTTLSQLKADAGRVVMLSDTPAHRYSTPDCLAQHPKDALACADSPKTAILTAHQSADERTAKAVGVSYLDVTPWFCTARLCPAVINNVVTTIDGNRITSTLADYLSNSLGLAVGILSDNSAQSSTATIKRAVAKATVPGTRWAMLLPPANIAPKDISPAYTDGCLVESLKLTSPPCTYPGPTASAERVVVFGDSHAAQWVPALQDSASRAKFSLTVLTKGNCPAPTITVYSPHVQQCLHRV